MNRSTRRFGYLSPACSTRVQVTRGSLQNWQGKVGGGGRCCVRAGEKWASEGRRNERSNALSPPPPRPPPRSRLRLLVRERSRKANVVAKAKEPRRVQRANTESHLSVPARSTPTAAAVVPSRVARRVVAARTNRAFSPADRTPKQIENWKRNS